ncbi:MAG: ABC transporter ATP-binding protein/permease [Lachnospiraceae bacterium]|nr:ABC transporter ATP-binding protein/permease [Lachnospiraceae bacterium]
MPMRRNNQSQDKATNFWGSIGKLFHYMGRYRIGVILVLLFAVASTIFNVYGPKLLGNATTELANGFMAKALGTGGIDFGAIGKILITLLVLYVASSIFNFLQGWIMSGISQKISYSLRKDISEKINRMPMAYFDSQATGDVLSRITNDVDTLGQSLNQSLRQLITSVATMVGVIIMMLTLSPLMTLITVIILPVSLICVVTIIRFSQKHFKAQQHYLGQIDGQIEESFSGQNIIKAFDREDKVMEEFKDMNERLYQSAWKSQFLSGLMQPVMNMISNAGYVAVVIVGGVLAAAGTIQIGDIVSFTQYVQRFTQPMTQLAQVSNMFQSMAAASERIFEFLEESEESQTVENPVQLEAAAGDVEFDHVSFGYHEDRVIIHDFTSEAKPGQTVAIVGPTGAGKTTMVKLLMRFYDVNSGAIRVDGHDLRDFNRRDLRQNIGMVLQDTWLFNGSIMENIRYGKPEATDEEVIEAAKTARADAFIRTLPGGYDMEINEEANNISQGQKQLLTIARAVLADRPILILDEATSSVDTRTELLIQEAMNRLMEGRTSFVIAHRLSTIRDADVILVMRDGDIVEQGNHEELLRQNGFYAELYNAQFEQ